MKGSTKKKIEGYLFIFPWIIGLSTFVIYPAGYGLVLGFFKFDIFNPPKWVGLSHFVRRCSPRIPTSSSRCRLPCAT